MGLRLYFGASGAGKSYQLYQEVIERSQKAVNQKFLIIVPDQFTMQTQKDIVTMHPRHGIMNIDVLSFGRLSHRIFEETGSMGRPVLEDTGKSLVLRKITQNLGEELPVIGSNLKKIGYIHEVKSAISEFMQYGIAPQDMPALTEAAKQRGSLYYKLKDLGTLYHEFSAYTKEKFVTAEETMDLLAEVLEQSELVKGSVVVFDGFTGFTPVQNKVIRELLRLASEVIVTVLMDERENPYEQDGEQRLFYLSKKTVSCLEKLAEEAGEKRGRQAREQDVYLKADPCCRFRDNPELAHLEKHIFRYPMKTFEGECGSLSIRELSNPREEIRDTALSIRRLVREKGFCYRDIAVIAGSLADYEVYVEEEFTKLGIPFFLDRTRGIVLNPFIEYMKSALRIREKNFTYEAMFHFLRSGMSSIGQEEADLLENYVLAAGIRGKKAWNSLFTRKSRDMSEEEQGETLQRLNQIRESIMKELGPLLERTNTAGDHVQRLYDFLVQNHAEEKLAEYERNFLKEGDFSAAKEYGQIYRLVMELLDQIAELLGEEKMSRREFIEILEAGFGEIQVGTIPQGVDKVVAGDLERTRLKQVKALFMIGINDGNVPKSGAKGGILSDMDREFLSEAMIELSPTPRQQMYIQRLYLYMNMTRPSEMLRLSYVRSGSDGKAKKPSYLIRMLTGMYPCLEISGNRRETVWELESPEDGLPLFIRMLREYAGGRLPEEELQILFLLDSHYRREELYRSLEEKLLRCAFYQYEHTGLGKETASLLYGQILQNSVSRLEKFAACAYAHFLQYGLTLEERELYSFEEVDMGNVFHGVLERFGEKLQERGYTWFDFPQEAGETIVAEALNAYAAEYRDTVLFSSARNQYAITRMERILKRTVHTLQYQLKKGAFVPQNFEVSFSMLEDLEAVNIALTEQEKMRLQGRIDRIDTAEEGDRVYVKVIDYKSGNRSFDLVSLYYGLQLQLVVYMNAALGLEQKKHPDKQVVPAAVLYYHVSDPMIRNAGETLTPEQINALLCKELAMTGMVSAEDEAIALLDGGFAGKSDVIPVERKKDGSFTARSSVAEENQFKQIADFANQKIREIGLGILAGDIRINPYEKGQQDSCTYCAYRQVCGFDPKIKGFAKRKLEISGDEAMEKICEQKGKT